VELPACCLPAGFEDAPTRPVRRADDVTAITAVLPPDRVETLCSSLLAAQQQLCTVPVDRTIAAIDHAARRLRDPHGPVRQQALRGLAAFTGFAPAMAEHVLDRVSDDWLSPALNRLVNQELGGVEAIEGFVRRDDGSRVRAVAPTLGLHVFSGNVPGVSVTSIIRALLVRSAVLGKPAAGEPVLAALFARLLTEADPLVGSCCAILYWPGGSDDIESAVLRHAGLVVHYGGEEAITSLQRRAGAGTRFVEHGPRVSFALVDATAADRRTAADLATAVALFDQQGCVSPQLAYVLGSPEQAEAFADLTADELLRLATELPRGRLQHAEAAAIHRLRTQAEFRAIAGENTRLWGGPSLSYTVIYEENSTFSGTPLNRTLIVKPVASIQQLLESVRPAGRFLQTVGIAGFGDGREEEIAAALGGMGATRITPISAMPWPPVTWQHDGRGPLRELVRWVDLEV
jgi:hypothetical protein